MLPTVVTYARKLCLGGLSIFVGRGTMAQAYFVAAVEAGFLMASESLQSLVPRFFCA